MQTDVRGVQPPKAILASPSSPTDRRTLAIQMVRKALNTSPAEVAAEVGMPLDRVLRALASMVAEFSMVTAGLVDQEQGARIGSAGLAASLRLAGIGVVARAGTSRADCRAGSKMAGVQGRRNAADDCHTRQGAANA